MHKSVSDFGSAGRGNLVRAGLPNSTCWKQFWVPQKSISEVKTGFRFLCGDPILTTQSGMQFSVPRLNIFGGRNRTKNRFQFFARRDAKSSSRAAIIFGRRRLENNWNLFACANAISLPLYIWRGSVAHK